MSRNSNGSLKYQEQQQQHNKTLHADYIYEFTLESLFSHP